MDKKTFRKICIDKAKKNKNVNTYKVDKLLNIELYKYIKKEKSKTVMLYVPLKNEVNISNLIIKLRREKRTLLVPFMEGESFSLVEYRLPLSKKQFGVKEPKNTNKYKHRIDLAIVPIIGTDSTLRRVGFGKGFYDRFFEKNHKRINKILFVGRTYCVSSEIISDDYDVKGDFYLTAKNCHYKSYLKRKSRI
ncbi:MAG: 5-formyltetrahydrofolate cyclo-ligase (EC [uncultured Sulfurovum sp.]|uniref:5-formyltetrahydrofolate cyclo-ligase n=1 Tax=uncultured Sulfurovum sp. TaxID=269237 RepID=A0A6S6TUJ7_9BACT|nr:MAG: 5-formyltetrahydrofolate cyclo-ligase (EC [uncultured Sulfurovum sp.]